MLKDDFGDRIKSNYEDRTRYYLPRRTYTVVRIDGKAFHSYTKNCLRPFDQGLTNDMNATAVVLCEKLSGAQLGYVQSDEISILLTDFTTPVTEAWYDNNLQKVVSISASIATTAFNKHRLLRINSEDPECFEWANFDSRAFSIPDRIEVSNYFIWRQLDAMRNSVSMVARSHFSHNDLEGQGGKEMKQMLLNKGVDWNQINEGFKYGRAIVKKQISKDITFINKKTKQEEHIEGVTRNEWCIEPAPFFVKNRSYLEDAIPNYPSTTESDS